jgi:hypothetical protein
LHQHSSMSGKINEIHLCFFSFYRKKN